MEKESSDRDQLRRIAPEAKANVGLWRQVMMMKGKCVKFCHRQNINFKIHL